MYNKPERKWIHTLKVGLITILTCIMLTSLAFNYFFYNGRLTRIESFSICQSSPAPVKPLRNAHKGIQP